MSDVTGELTDTEGARLVLAADGDTVTITTPSGAHGWRLDAAQREEFGRLWVAACWDADANGERMRQEAAGG